MNLKVLFDWSRFPLGRVVLAFSKPQKEGEPDSLIDQEMVRKHPFLLRLRMNLAVKRMRRRQRKIAKFLERYEAGKV